MFIIYLYYYNFALQRSVFYLYFANFHQFTDKIFDVMNLSEAIPMSENKIKTE
jgi:hypothetical protein